MWFLLACNSLEDIWCEKSALNLNFKDKQRVLNIWINIFLYKFMMCFKSILVSRLYSFPLTLFRSRVIKTRVSLAYNEKSFGDDAIMSCRSRHKRVSVWRAKWVETIKKNLLSTQWIMQALRLNENHIIKLYYYLLICHKKWAA